MKVIAKHPPSSTQSTLPLWRWGALALLLVLVVGASLLLAGRDTAETGTLAAEQSQHDFGQVRMSGGLLTARFSLTVQGATRITDLQSS